MPQLAAKIENLPWIDDGVDSPNEWQAVQGLISLADAGHTAKLIEEPWVVEGRNYPALESLGTLFLYYPEDFSTVMTHPTVSDGITGQEAKTIATLYSLRDYGLLDQLLDPGQVTVEERTIVLPLAGETELAIIRTKPGADHTMDLLEHSVRSIEEFMGLPFPQRQVIYAFVDDPEGPVSGRNSRTHVGVFIDEQQMSGGILLAHEAAHYYWSTATPWLHEGAATFLASMADNLLHEALGWAPCGTIAELEAGYPILEAAIAEPCDYILGERLFRELYSSMDDQTFRLGFRRLYLHTQWHVPDGCDDLYDRTTICHVREAFTAYASEDVKARIEEVITHWYAGPADIPDDPATTSIRGVVIPGPDGWPLGMPASLRFLGKAQSLFVDTYRDGSFDAVVPSGSYIIEVLVWVHSENPSVDYTSRLLGWYDGSGGVTTDPSQALEVTVAGADVEGIEIMLPADIESLLCPPGSWRSSRDGQCLAAE